MSPAQQKLMQYLPVFFAVFQIFFLLGLVVYYIVQSVLRILQQYYITRRFYHGDESLGRQAQAASVRARDLAKADGGSTGMFGQARRDLAQARDTGTKPAAGRGKQDTPAVSSSRRTTPPKNRPTPSAKPVAGRPGQRPASGKKRRRG